MSLTITTELSSPVGTPARLVASGQKRKKTLGSTIRQATVVIGAGDERITLDAYLVLRRTDIAADAKGLPETVREALTQGLVSWHTSVVGRCTPALAERITQHVDTAALRASDKREALESAYARLLKGIPVSSDKPEAAVKPTTVARDMALAMLDDDAVDDDDEADAENADTSNN